MRKVVPQTLRSSIIGLSEKEAIDKITVAGFKARVTVRDGKAGPVTAEMRADRLNLAITDGKVTASEIG